MKITISAAVLSFASFVALTACGDAGSAQNSTGNLKLVFQNGYEGSVGIPSDAHTDITGADTGFSEKNNWVKDLEGHPQVGNFFIFYEGGNSSQRYARTVNNPTDASSKVLHFWLNEAYIPYGNNRLKGRIQATISLGNTYEMLTKHKLYFPQDMAALKNSNESFNWLTVQEFWNNQVDTNYPFRISVNIVKPSKAHELYFEAKGQTKIAGKSAWKDVWRAVGTNFSIPIDEWFTFDTYFKEGNKYNGRFKITLTDKSGNKYEAINVTDFTYHPDDPSPDGLNNFNVMKLYAPERLINPMRKNGKTLQFYWDDFELWL